MACIDLEELGLEAFSEYFMSSVCLKAVLIGNDCQTADWGRRGLGEGVLAFLDLPGHSIAGTQ